MGRAGENLNVEAYDWVDGFNVFSMTIEAPDGERLKVGEYRWAQDWSHKPNRPALYVFAEQYCGDQTGHFEIRDLVREGDRIVQLWVVYEWWCDRINVGWGEVRFGYPGAADFDVAPDVSFQPLPVDVGEPGSPSPFASATRWGATAPSLFGIP